MAKDPAVLFYTSDFLSGTFTMSHEQVGKYIRLLCLQHQNDQCGLTEEDMMNICQTYDSTIWGKFKKEGDLFYNVRMREEKLRRSEYAESRRNNRKRRLETYDKDMNNICSTHVEHMETETETETETVVVKEQIKKIAENVLKHYKSLRNVRRMKQTLTFVEAYKLCDKYGLKAVIDILDAMENWDDKKLLKKSSVYLTANSWLQRDKKQNPSLVQNYYREEVTPPPVQGLSIWEQGYRGETANP